jgi:hypothetical protein
MNTLHIDTPSDGIAVLTFDRPQAHNALDMATMRAFAEAIRQPYESALQPERALFAALWTGEAHAQAMDKFLQRRGR